MIASYFLFSIILFVEYTNESDKRYRQTDEGGGKKRTKITMKVTIQGD